MPCRELSFENWGNLCDAQRRSSRRNTRERMQLAKDLLNDPQRNIAEIGWACGFNAPSYFIRVFRQQTGVTPRTYRITKL
ncbi:MAG: helix-turn-helix transcriptional regulator [Terrimicrobiaceae bacterium]